MSTSLRILAVSALLTANLAMFTGPAGAASLDEPLPIAKAVPIATKPVYWRGRGWGWGGRRYGWRAPSELIAGVRGASPLTVPFYGSGWYPGPAYYYGPRPVVYYRGGGDAVAYCMQRFRSYDPGSGTYLGNDGYRHPCP
jgi:hypothetical protein